MASECFVILSENKRIDEIKIYDMSQNVKDYSEMKIETYGNKSEVGCKNIILHLSKKAHVIKAKRCCSFPKGFS